jgi:hypothetical protein
VTTNVEDSRKARMRLRNGALAAQDGGTLRGMFGPNHEAGRQ